MTTTCVDGFFESAGSRMHYLHWRKAGRPTLVGLPGFQENARCFDPLQDHLCRHFDLYVLDWRGHGGSPPLREGVYSASTALYDLALFDLTVLPAKYGLLGHCFGADVAALWAALRPQRVDSLVLVGTNSPWSRGDDAEVDALGALRVWVGRLESALRASACAAPRLRSMQDAHDAIRWLHPGVSAERRERLATLLTVRDTEGRIDWHYAHDFLTRWPPLHPSPRLLRQVLAAVSCPTLALVGASPGVAAPAGAGDRLQASAPAGHEPDEMLAHVERHGLEVPNSEILQAAPDAVIDCLQAFWHVDHARVTPHDREAPAASVPRRSSGSDRGPDGDRMALIDVIRAALAAQLQCDPTTLRPDTRLDELDVDSLGWVTVLVHVQATLQCTVPHPDFVQATTIGDLAEFVGRQCSVPSTQRDRASGAASLIALHRPRAPRPLFFASGLTGSVASLAPLAAAISLDQPFFVFGVADADSPATQVQTIAQRFIEAVRARQPRGPYRLGGYSFGGLVAYEAAWQLHRVGEAVSRVLILDTFVNPEGDRAAAAAGATDEMLADLAPYAADPRYRRAWWANAIAYRCYRPPPSELPVTLFQSAGGMPVALRQALTPGCDPTLGALGWAAVCPRTLKVLPAGGDHFTMLHPPHVQALGAACRSCLDASDDATAYEVGLATHA